VCADPNDSQAIPSPDAARAAPAQQAVVLHTDLARVVELWPVLPPAIRAAVLTLVNAPAPPAPKAPPTNEADLDSLPPGVRAAG
jgi:hypothetical protein